MASHRHGSGGDGHQDTYDVAQVGTEDPGVSRNSSLGQAVEEAPEEAGQGHDGPLVHPGLCCKALQELQLSD